MAVCHKKPERLMIYGNGFQPTEDAAEYVKQSWLLNNKHLFGEDAADGVKTIIGMLPWISGNKFDNAISQFRNQYKGHAIDADITMFVNAKPINNTVPAILLLAVWSETDSKDVIELIKNENEKGKKVNYNENNEIDKKWWQFWK